jgi:DNA helicase-2/ATP-dependent DNA helicase PcrA
MVAFSTERRPDEGAAANSELEIFLQHVSLITDIDQYDPDEGAVSLMTLHNAKGMEFPIVFIGGAEEGLLPLGRSTETAEELEEERRLFYVGLTRAMDRLFVTHVSHRFRAGSSMPCLPSSFLDDLPDEAVDRRMSGLSGWTAARRSAFGGGTDGRRPSVWESSADGSAGRGFDWQFDPVGRAETGPVYDYSESQEPFELVTGARIVHPRFGQGTVVSVSGDGMAAKARIEFDSDGPKTVMVAHAGLRPAT